MRNVQVYYIQKLERKDNLRLVVKWLRKIRNTDSILEMKILKKLPAENINKILNGNMLIGQLTNCRKERKIYKIVLRK